MSMYSRFRLLQMPSVSISTHSIPIWLSVHCCSSSVSKSCVLSLEFYASAGLTYFNLHPSLLALSCYDGSVSRLTCQASAGVMCLNFHPQHPNLLALGCYDGSVNVYDVRKGSKPLYTSTAATGKHTDPVWEIFWQVSLPLPACAKAWPDRSASWANCSLGSQAKVDVLRVMGIGCNTSVNQSAEA